MRYQDLNQQLVDDLRVVLHRAEELLDDTANASGEKAHAARQKLGEASDALRDRWARLQDLTTEAARTSRRVAREHPYETVGTGLAVLAVLGAALYLARR